MVNRLISQLHHVEVITPKPEESLRFYRDVLGLNESGRAGQSVYLRGWGEFFHHSLQLTEGPEPAVAHTGWRTEGPEELQQAVKQLEAAGAGLGWREAETGHGPAYRFQSPGGQVHEVFWEAERHKPAPGMEPIVPNRPERFVPHGAAARRIDHVTFNTDDPVRDAHWFRDVLGFRFTEWAKLDFNDMPILAFCSTTPMSHDLGLVRDSIDMRGTLSGMKGRVNHVAFWVDQREDVLRTADIYREAGLEIEYGPGKHGVGENLFLYLREPGGMRVELFSGGYMLYAPDIFPFEWKISQGTLNAWTPQLPPPEGFLFDAFPPVKRDKTDNVAAFGQRR